MFRRMQIAPLARLALFAALVTFAGCASPGRQDGASLKHGGMAGVVNQENRPIDPFRIAAGDTKAIVFIFVRTDCPISNRYAPEIERLHQKYKMRGVAFWLVFPETDATSEEISSH